MGEILKINEHIIFCIKCGKMHSGEIPADWHFINDWGAMCGECHAKYDPDKHGNLAQYAGKM